jgi:pteridine reductase
MALEYSMQPEANRASRDEVALVTGAARRIGAAIARELHGAGARVVLHCNRSRTEAEALAASLNAVRAGSAAVVQGDLLDAPGLPRLVERAVAAFGRLDALVNNASSFYATPLGAIGPREWDDLIGTNLRAPLLLAQAAAPALRAARGSIVNIVDIHSERPLAGYLVYSIAKAGLAGLTRALALELAPEVRVNGVSPGAILWPEASGHFEGGERERITAQTPLARIGDPADVAGAVKYLLLDAPFVTGQILAVDGGRSLSL